MAEGIRKRNPDYILIYGRGYSAGSRSNWPKHRPPQPPNKLVSDLMAASQLLRDSADGFLSQIEEDDELQSKFGDPIDALDSAMAAISEWLTTPTPETP